MFGKPGNSKPQARIDTLIGVGTRIEGNIAFAGGLRVDGEIKGGVSVVGATDSSILVLSEQARIEGPVVVAHLVTNGTIVGPVVVTESLEMQPRSRIVGDVKYASIEMHQGAVIEGRLVHAQRGVEEPKQQEKD